MKPDYSLEKIKKCMISVLLIICLCIGAGTTSYAAVPNCYSYLLMPTQITKIGTTYFIVDCNHNQILYNEQLDHNLCNWNVMTRNLCSPHAIAGDGDIYMVADTDNNRILTFEKSGDSFRQLQCFENTGIRPHFVYYNHADNLFYAWSSMTGEMYLYKRSAPSRELVLQEIKNIPEFNNCYVRSFTISGDYILFPVIERSSIVVADINTFQILEEHPVPAYIAGMVQISIIGDYFYLTVSTDLNYDLKYSTIIRARSLTDFTNGTYENLYSTFGGNGTPYYISAFDGAYYLIHENASPNVYRFHVQDNIIQNVKGIF